MNTRIFPMVCVTSVLAASACGFDGRAAGDGPGVSGVNGSSGASGSSGAGGTSGSSGAGSSGLDASGPGSDAAAEGGEAGAACKDGVLAFDGVDDEGSIADSPAFDLGGDFTVEAWVRPSARALTGVEMDVVSHHDGASSRGWVLLMRNGRVEIIVLGNTVLVPTGMSAGNDGAAYVVPDVWAHVAGTLQGKTLRIYYDGILRDTQDLGGVFSRDGYGGALRFGRMAGNAEFPYEGQLDDVRLSGKARYVGPTAPIPTAGLPADADTVASYHFDEPSGLVLKDGTMLHDGTLPTDTTAAARVVTPCIGYR